VRVILYQIKADYTDAAANSYTFSATTEKFVIIECFRPSSANLNRQCQIARIEGITKKK
jgi:hypothetical protein